MTAKYGEVPVLDSVATYDAEEGRVAAFVVNRNPTESVSFSTNLPASAMKLTEATLIWDEDLFAVNSMEEPERVRPKAHTSAEVHGTELRAELPPASWSVFVVSVS